MTCRSLLFAEMGDPVNGRGLLRSISPVLHAEKILAPLLVLQGANDPRVLQVESDEIVAAARGNGVPVEYVVFPDEGHGFLRKENQIAGYTPSIAFLDKSEGIDVFGGSAVARHRRRNNVRSIASAHRPVARVAGMQVIARIVRRQQLQRVRRDRASPRRSRSRRRTRRSCG